MLCPQIACGGCETVSMFSSVTSTFATTYLAPLQGIFWASSIHGQFHHVLLDTNYFRASRAYRRDGCGRERQNYTSNVEMDGPRPKLRR
jgi:hypothetical protein